MLTAEENEVFVRVGPGTPAGELLRRYWHPIAVAQELTDEQPTKFLRVLAEDLVLFKDKRGRVGLLADHCAHRGASLLYGRVEERGIACAYHGWLYDTGGNCLECPAEPAGSMFHLTVKHRAYPVQKVIGLYWAYLGPDPAPVIPHFDIWFRKDGRRRVVVHPRVDCNWFQTMENAVDPAHLPILHQELAGGRERVVTGSGGFTNQVDHTDLDPFPYGIMKKRVYKSGLIDEHPMIFPTVTRVNNSSEIRVPIDDTHTMNFEPFFYPTPDGSEVEEEDPAVVYLPAFKNPPDALHPFTRFRWDMVSAQDTAAWETQGPIAARTLHRLASADRGIVMLREMVKENIERVQQGLDPLGVVRDPDHAIIDTNLTHGLEYMRQRGSAQLDYERAVSRPY